MRIKEEIRKNLKMSLTDNPFSKGHPKGTTGLITTHTLFTSDWEIGKKVSGLYFFI